MFELLWKTRQLYERLLDRTKHLKVGVSYTKFEATFPLEEETRAQVEEREPNVALLEEQTEDQCIRSQQQKEERAILLQEWREMEKSFGEFGAPSPLDVKKQMDL
ncbi:unnamed protein product [Calypogeia fissa]